MTRGFVLGMVAVVVLLAGAVWLTASSTFLYRHPKAPHLRIVMDYQTNSAVLAPLPGSRSSTSEVPSTGRPRASAPERTFDFGVMNPSTSGRHEFVVRNEGTTPLKLSVGPTTCKCTVSGVAKNDVPPGGETTVTMDWNTGRDSEYAHSAVIYTNDPDQQSLEFTVKGQIRVIAAAEPHELRLPIANPDSRAVAEVFLHSQMWSDLQVVDAAAALEDFTWHVEDVPPAQVPELAAKSVKKLRVEFVNPSQGSFGDSLQVTVQDAGSGETALVSIPISGSTRRKLSFYGPAIDSLGIIDLGNITEGSSSSAKLIAKVRDEDLALGDVQLEVFPEFVQAKFQPHPGGQPGMYQLVLDVPAGIGPCQYKSNPSGRVVIRTSHPRIGEVELGLAFAIVPRSP